MIEIQKELVVDGVVSFEMMNIFMRRFQQLDVDFAAKYGESCWRHFLEPDFVVRVVPF